MIPASDNPAAVLLALLCRWALATGRAPEDVIDLPLALHLIDLCETLADDENA
jgi:hypothetical protein